MSEQLRWEHETTCEEDKLKDRIVRLTTAKVRAGLHYQEESQTRIADTPLFDLLGELMAPVVDELHAKPCKKPEPKPSPKTKKSGRITFKYDENDIEIKRIKCSKLGRYSADCTLTFKLPKDHRHGLRFVVRDREGIKISRPTVGIRRTEPHDWTKVNELFAWEAREVVIESNG